MLNGWQLSGRHSNCGANSPLQLWEMCFLSPAMLGIIYQNKSNLFWDYIHKYPLLPVSKWRVAIALQQTEEEGGDASEWMNEWMNGDTAAAMGYKNTCAMSSGVKNRGTAQLPKTEVMGPNL